METSTGLLIRMSRIVTAHAQSDGVWSEIICTQGEFDWLDRY